MIQKLVTEIGGIASFGMISGCLFFIVFTGSLVWALFQKQAFLRTMESLPLEDEDDTLDPKGANRHE